MRGVDGAGAGVPRAVLQPVKVRFADARFLRGDHIDRADCELLRPVHPDELLAGEQVRGVGVLVHGRHDRQHPGVHHLPVLQRVLSPRAHRVHEHGRDAHEHGVRVPGAATIAHRRRGELHGVDVLHRPLLRDVHGGRRVEFAGLADGIQARRRRGGLTAGPLVDSLAARAFGRRYGPPGAKAAPAEDRERRFGGWRRERRRAGVDGGRGHDARAARDDDAGEGGTQRAEAETHAKAARAVHERRRGVGTGGYASEEFVGDIGDELGADVDGAAGAPAVHSRRRLGIVRDGRPDQQGIHTHVHVALVDDSRHRAADGAQRRKDVGKPERRQNNRVLRHLPQPHVLHSRVLPGSGRALADALG